MSYYVLESNRTTKENDMKIGYARTSTIEQEAGLEAQLRDLTSCDKVFQEKVSSVAKRQELESAIEFIREGDTLVVTKLDRLARSTRHLMEIVETLKDKNAHLSILNLGIDTNTPTGKLMLTMLGGVAEFEREIMLERQREGIVKAKGLGKYKGRQPTAKRKLDQIMALNKEGIGATKIAKELGVSRSSVYRLLAG
jgi:DNA invertase Pin-like site-specific DNA recombinase